MDLSLANKRDHTVTEVVSEYGQRLFRFIRSRVSTNADAEDILQDVWYQFSRIVAVEPIEQVSGWLFRVARNRVTDNYRKKRLPLVDDIAPDTDDESEWLRDQLLADDNTPETELLREMFWEELMAALDELPEDQRNAFVWNELEGRTFQEIADETGESLKTWISRKRYAVKYLRQKLSDLYDDFMDF